MVNQLQDVGAIAVAGAMIIPIVAIVAGVLYKMRRAELQTALRQDELQLKREMVQKGMSADEIVQVLSACAIPPAQEARCGRQQQQQWQS